MSFTDECIKICLSKPSALAEYHDLTFGLSLITTRSTGLLQQTPTLTFRNLMYVETF